MAKPIVILDSTPLSLLVKRQGAADADACRAWLVGHVRDKVRFYVPEIVRYELRRELLRIGSTDSLDLLDAMIAAEPDRLLRLTSAALDRAADLWAQVRRQGRPTADAAALDIDVILAAQVLTAKWDVDQTVTATSNAKHVGLFVPAAEWRSI